MKIYIGTDHAGYDLKEQLKQFLVEELGHDVADFGADLLPQLRLQVSLFDDTASV